MKNVVFRLMVVILISFQACQSLKYYDFDDVNNHSDEGFIFTHWFKLCDSFSYECRTTAEADSILKDFKGVIFEKSIIEKSKCCLLSFKSFKNDDLVQEKIIKFMNRNKNYFKQDKKTPLRYTFTLVKKQIVKSFYFSSCVLTFNIIKSKDGNVKLSIGDIFTKRVDKNGKKIKELRLEEINDSDMSNYNKFRFRAKIAHIIQHEIIKRIYPIERL